MVQVLSVIASAVGSSHRSRQEMTAKKRDNKESKVAEEGQEFLKRAGSVKRREIKRNPLPDKAAAKKEKVEKVVKKVKKTKTMAETAKEGEKLLATDPLGDTTKTGYKPYDGTYKA